MQALYEDVFHAANVDDQPTKVKKWLEKGKVSLERLYRQTLNNSEVVIKSHRLHTQKVLY